MRALGLEFGLWVLGAVLGALILLNVFVRGGRETLAICRDSLAEGARLAGPVLVEQYDTTVFVPRGAWAGIDRWANLVGGAA